MKYETSRQLRSILIAAIKQLGDFIPNMDKRTMKEVEAKAEALTKLLKVSPNSRLLNPDRAAVQKFYFDLDYKVRGKIQQVFPKIDEIIKDKIFH